MGIPDTGTITLLTKGAESAEFSDWAGAQGLEYRSLGKPTPSKASRLIC